MFRRISHHLRDQLGSDDVCLVLADTDGKNLLLYSNRALKGYHKGVDGYSKQVPLDEITKNQMDCLKRKDPRFYAKETTVSESGPGWKRTEIKAQRPDLAESGVIATGSNPHAYCRTGKLAEAMGTEEYGGGGFSAEGAEGVLAHEGTHGIIHSVYDRLEDLFGEDAAEHIFDKSVTAAREFSGRLDAYRMLGIIDEAVATLVGIKYLENFYPKEASRYNDFISTLETDGTHEEANRLVLYKRDRVEEMRNLVKLLNCVRCNRHGR